MAATRMDSFGSSTYLLDQDALDSSSYDSGSYSCDGFPIACDSDDSIVSAGSWYSFLTSSDSISRPSTPPPIPPPPYWPPQAAALSPVLPGSPRENPASPSQKSESLSQEPRHHSAVVVCAEEMSYDLPSTMPSSSPNCMRHIYLLASARLPGYAADIGSLKMEASLIKSGQHCPSKPRTWKQYSAAVESSGSETLSSDSDKFQSSPRSFQLPGQLAAMEESKLSSDSESDTDLAELSTGDLHFSTSDESYVSQLCRRPAALLKPGQHQPSRFPPHYARRLPSPQPPFPQLPSPQFPTPQLSSAQVSFAQLSLHQRPVQKLAARPFSRLYKRRAAVKQQQQRSSRSPSPQSPQPPSTPPPLQEGLGQLPATSLSDSRQSLDRAFTAEVEAFSCLSPQPGQALAASSASNLRQQLRSAQPQSSQPQASGQRPSQPQRHRKDQRPPTEVMLFSSREKLFESLSYITSMKDMCDVVFHVGSDGQLVHGVKAVLSARSRLMFQNILQAQKQKQEAQAQGAKHNKNKKRLFPHTLRRSKQVGQKTKPDDGKVHVEVRDYDFDVFSGFVDFLHSGRVTVDKNTAIGLYCASVEYDVKDLRVACVDYIARTFNKGSGEFLLTAGRDYRWKPPVKELIRRLYPGPLEICA